MLQISRGTTKKPKISQGRVVILGSGNIGTDLLFKVRKSKNLECTGFVGRGYNSIGMHTAMDLGVRCSDKGIEYITQNAHDIDLVFDATSAHAHDLHAPILAELGIPVINLTPAPIGLMTVPSVNGEIAQNILNLNMITCGGQASVPIAHAFGKVEAGISYVEVVSSIASKSAGPATRRNLDEYIRTTEAGVIKFSGAEGAKAILNLNPASPCIDMQTTIFAEMVDPNIEKLKKEVYEAVARVKRYVPGYELILGPLVENGRVVVTVRVRGAGDFLPPYAGNLDIINCAAIAMAEEFAKNRVVKVN